MADVLPGPGGAGAAPKPAPFGTSGATAPSPNLGYEAAALQKVGVIVKQLEEMIPLVGAATDFGKAIMDSLNKLVKFVPPGAVTPAAEKNQLEQAMMRNTQNNQQVQSLRQSQGMGQSAPQPPAMPKVA